MTETNGDVRAKMALLKLVEELNSVTKACEIMGYSRDSYYRFKKQYDKGGVQALKNVDKRKPMPKNRISADIEKQVIEFALDYPKYGQEKVSKLLEMRGVNISASGVRSVWKRHDLESQKKRIKALHAKVEQENRSLTEQQKQHIEHLHLMSQDQVELDTRSPGDIGVQDTIFIGHVLNVGDVYQQTFVDAYSKVVLAKLYTSKSAATSVDMLENVVLPWLNQKNIPLKQMLTDRGGEYFGKSSGGDLYQQALGAHSIEHIKMRAYNSPEVNGICERFHKVQQADFYNTVFREISFSTLEELEAELQSYLAKYNENTPHQERYCFGKTPMATLEDSMHLINR